MSGIPHVTLPRFARAIIGFSCKLQRISGRFGAGPPELFVLPTGSLPWLQSPVPRGHSYCNRSPYAMPVTGLKRWFSWLVVPWAFANELSVLLKLIVKDRISVVKINIVIVPIAVLLFLIFSFPYILLHFKKDNIVIELVGI